jgi:undecaprenyl-diphosphatase
VAQRLLGVSSPGIVPEVALHVATTSAVLLYYRRRLLTIFTSAAGGREGWLRFVGLLLVASAPAALLGFFAEDRLAALFESSFIAGAGLLFTAAVLGASAFVPRRPGTVARLAWAAALAVGVAQAVAIVPGISRAGMTVVAGLAVGLAGEEAAAFSFLLSVPAVLGAGVLELRKAGDFTGSWPALAAACAVACVVGLVAIRVVARTARGRGFAWFGVYCAAVGFGALWLR